MILEIRRGQAKQLNRIISEPVFLIGSGDDCDMVLGDRQFDEVHFYLLRRDGRTTMRRIGKSPDVTVNGKPQKAATPIVPGDRIRTGPFEFLVKAA